MAAKVALFLMNDKSAHQLLLRADAERAGRRHGFEVEVYGARDNVTNQIREMRDCIRREAEARPYAILLFPVRDEAVERVAREAVAAGVGWLVINRRADYIAALRAQAPSLPIATVGPDQHEIGLLQARQVAALSPGGGHVLSVRGPTLSSGAKDRMDGLREGLKDARVTLSEVAGNWHTEDAERAVGSWLELVLPTGLRPGLVACQNDAMAIGARSALRRLASQGQRAELAQVPVIGVDGIETEGRKYVDDGLLAATIVLPSSTGPAVELAAKCAKGEPIPENVATPISSYPSLSEIQKRGSTA